MRQAVANSPRGNGIARCVHPPSRNLHDAGPTLALNDEQTVNPLLSRSLPSTIHMAEHLMASRHPCGANRRTWLGSLSFYER